MPEYPASRDIRIPGIASHNPVIRNAGFAAGNLIIAGIFGSFKVMLPGTYSVVYLDCNRTGFSSREMPGYLRYTLITMNHWVLPFFRQRSPIGDYYAGEKNPDSAELPDNCSPVHVFGEK